MRLVTMVSREEKLRIKELVRIEELVREVVPGLEARGADDFWGLCPFHTEDTASFHVRPSVGFYKCFGCDESGDVFDFVQKTQGLGFLEAADLLARRAGVPLGTLSPEDRQRRQTARRVRDVLEAARIVFARDLESSPALRHMVERGFSRETLQAFDVGHVPPDFARALRAAGVSAAQLEEAGFTRAFAGRVSFAIRDAAGSLVGFGARRIDGQDAMKYVNTRETPGFAKRRLLYGFSQAARVLGRTRRLVVMEGYTDVLMAHQAGVPDAVATMGTSFTDEHLRLIGGRVSNLVFVFDGDDAGQRAAERAVRKALEGGLESRVVSLPDGADPCDWFAAGRSGADLDRLLEERGEATVAFLCRRLLAQADPGQPGVREQVAHEVRELTRRLTDPVRRQALVVDIARVCAVDRRLLERVAVGAAVPAASGGPGRRGRPLPARVRSQIVAVAGLATDPASAAELEELCQLGALDHPGALRLRALGLELRDGEGRVDGLEWLRCVQAQEPELAPVLERELVPPPGAVPHPRAEAVAYLRQRRRAEQAADARRAALARPGIASDAQRLRAVQDSLRETGPGAAGKEGETRGLDT